VVTVERIDGENWKVVVQARATTTHRVHVSPEACLRYGGENCDPERLLLESFRFLLERELNTSILSSFDLTVISRYFPEYDAEIPRRLANG
jgi:hypothetical protein